MSRLWACDWDCGSLGGTLILQPHLTITTAQMQALNKSLLRRLWLQMNHYCADSGFKLITTAQILALNESLLRRLWLQINHYCTDSGSKLITTVQIAAPNESLLRRLRLQMNHYCVVLSKVPTAIPHFWNFKNVHFPLTFECCWVDS